MKRRGLKSNPDYENSPGLRAVFLRAHSTAFLNFLLKDAQVLEAAFEGRARDFGIRLPQGAHGGEKPPVERILEERLPRLILKARQRCGPPIPEYLERRFKSKRSDSVRRGVFARTPFWLAAGCRGFRDALEPDLRTHLAHSIRKSFRKFLAASSQPGLESFSSR
jgi:hypothetical protein